LGRKVLALPPDLSTARSTDNFATLRPLYEFVGVAARVSCLLHLRLATLANKRYIVLPMQKPGPLHG